MIRLTRINDSPFYLNCDLIEYIDVTPDTVLTMAGGGKVMVKEGAEEVVRRVVEFRRRLCGVREGGLREVRRAGGVGSGVGGGVGDGEVEWDSGGPEPERSGVEPGTHVIGAR